MKWKQIDRAGLESDDGRFRISRAAAMRGKKMVIVYRLWKMQSDGQAEAIGTTYNSADEAKQEAERCEE